MNPTYGFRSGQLVGLPRLCIRHISSTKPKRPSTGFQGPEGHGEKVWVWSHRRQEQVIYGFKPTLENHHALKQLPFNGKKTKPAKLRKDYWSPLAVIEFPAGQGAVGRSVYQKLRELKHLHEVQWDVEEMRYKTELELTKAERRNVEKAIREGREPPRVQRTVKERGFALNRQKKNAIADMAAVLSGLGRGNKMLVGGEEGAMEAAAKGDSVTATGTTLVPVTVNWTNDQDRNYAQQWSDNVTHGLFEKPTYVVDPQATAPGVAEAPQTA